MKNTPFHSLMGYWNRHGILHNVTQHPLNVEEEALSEKLSHDAFTRAAQMDNSSADLQPQDGRVFCGRDNASFSCDFSGDTHSGSLTAIQAWRGRSQLFSVRADAAHLSTISVLRNWDGGLMIHSEKVDRLHPGDGFWQEAAFPMADPWIPPGPSDLEVPQAAAPNDAQLRAAATVKYWSSSLNLPDGARHRAIHAKEAAGVQEDIKRELGDAHRLDNSRWDHNPFAGRVEWPMAANHYSNWLETDGAEVRFSSIRREYKETTFLGMVSRPDEMSYLWMNHYEGSIYDIRSWHVDLLNPKKSIYQELTL